jgi:TonB family protein
MRTFICVLMAAALSAPLSSGGTQGPPGVIKRVDPAYPAILKMAGIEGEVEVKVVLDRTGAIENVSILKGSRDELNNAAVEAVKQWQFSPGMDHGTPVRSEIVVPFRFQLGPGSFRTSGDQRDTLRQNAIALLRRGLTPALRTMIDPTAFVIIGPKRGLLVTVLERKEDAATLIEGNETAMAWSEVNVDPSGNSAVLAFESKTPSRRTSRFHTVSFSKSETGWMIQGWHVSQ